MTKAYRVYFSKVGEAEAVQESDRETGAGFGTISAITIVWAVAVIRA